MGFYGTAKRQTVGLQRRWAYRGRSLFQTGWNEAALTPRKGNIRNILNWESCKARRCNLVESKKEFWCRKSKIVSSKKGKTPKYGLKLRTHSALNKHRLFSFGVNRLTGKVHTTRNYSGLGLHTAEPVNIKRWLYTTESWAMITREEQTKVYFLYSKQRATQEINPSPQLEQKCDPSHSCGENGFI